MTAELRLMSIPEIMGMASGSVDIANKNGECDWWGIIAAKASAGHFDNIVDTIASEGFGMPIVLCDRYNDGRYVIGNGHHRLVAAILLGLWRIPVMVSEGANRDDFMRPEDSMDDYGKPIERYGMEYWGMLEGNIEQDDYRAAWEDAESEHPEFYCGDCGEYYRNSVECCLTDHRAAHHIPEACGWCDNEAEEYADHKMGCPERDWDMEWCSSCGFSHYLRNLCESMIDAIHEDALSEDYAWEAEAEGYRRVGAAYPIGAFHPEGVLRDAYAEDEAFERDRPMREALAHWHACIKDMREVCQFGASEYVINAHAAKINDAWNAYMAL